MAITRHTLSALLVIGLSMPINESLAVKPGDKIKQNYTKYPEDDTITLHSVFCMGTMERWILSLSLYIYIMNS